MPPFVLVNSMYAPPVPPELSCLNSMEKESICAIQPFMKLVVLPYGQHTLQGQTVNFPVNTSKVCILLRKTLDNAGIVLIAPPRTGGSDTTEAPVPQNYFSIWRPYVVRALHWLRNNNTLFRGIEIEEVSDDTPSTQRAANEILFWSCNVLKQRRLNENSSVAIQMRLSSGSIRVRNCSVCRQSTSNDAS